MAPCPIISTITPLLETSASGDCGVYYLRGHYLWNERPGDKPTTEDGRTTRPSLCTVTNIIIRNPLSYKDVQYLLFFMINFCQTKHAAYIVYAVCVIREKRNGQVNDSTFAFAEARVTEKASPSRHSPPLEFPPAFSILIWFIVKTLESGEGLSKRTLLKSLET